MNHVLDQTPTVVEAVIPDIAVCLGAQDRVQVQGLRFPDRAALLHT